MRQRRILRAIPSVNDLLSRDDMQEIIGRHSRERVKSALKIHLSELREKVRKKHLTQTEFDDELKKLPQKMSQALENLARISLAPVINATGVIIHTNLGRAPLAKEILKPMEDILCGYSNLEIDILTGKRAKREAHAEKAFLNLIPAEAIHIVNNNAGAVLLALNTLADGREVIVSRGELVEIGGDFRLPDVLAKSGAVLREVGTTNRTKLSDYARAVGKKTGAILKIHPSNFRIIGFSQSARIKELARLSRKKKIPLIYDFGSGNIFKIPGVEEPALADEIKSGADIITFSADKLLGGPQAGIIAGRKRYIDAMKKNPLSRALRVDKMTLASLAGTLSLYNSGDFLKIPVLRMVMTKTEEIRRRAESLQKTLAQIKPEWNIKLVNTISKIGGGAAPTAELRSAALAISHPALSSQALAEKLRTAKIPVIARIKKEKIVLDLRTVLPGEEPLLIKALSEIN